MPIISFGLAVVVAVVVVFAFFSCPRLRWLVVQVSVEGSEACSLEIFGAPIEVGIMSAKESPTFFVWLPPFTPFVFFFFSSFF